MKSVYPLKDSLKWNKYLHIPTWLLQKEHCYSIFSACYGHEMFNQIGDFKLHKRHVEALWSVRVLFVGAGKELSSLFHT